MHAGALGDWVLIWPLLRALARGGAHVVAVSHESKARLAAKWVECSPGTLSALPGGIDQPRLSRWWGGPGEFTGAETDWASLAPGRIISFLCDDSTPAGRAWLASATAEFPGARIETVGAPDSASRKRQWSIESIDALARVAARSNDSGPVICHLGAGSDDKRWPIDRWHQLITALRSATVTVDVIGGEVELERFTSDERRIFTALGGRFIESLDELARSLAAARLFIGGDTGPTHLAAQLGIPTLALFGPTDPAVWSPIGPCVQVLAPANPFNMTWLTPGAAFNAAMAMLKG
jgi:hypothetical protein